MIRGQVVLRPLGIEGIPIFNIENACASAASALHLGWQAVATGLNDVVLCVGAEKLSHEDKTVGMEAIGTAIDVEMRAELAEEIRADGSDEGGKRSFFMDLYADMARRYMRASGATPEHL
jgi:acetyl-CoA acetyltransferase